MNWNGLLTPLNLLLCSGVSFCLGLLLGHRLALGRDKRQEWNPIAREYREILERQIEAAQYGNIASGIREVTSEVLFYLGPWERRRFRLRLGQYEKAAQEASESSRTNRGIADAGKLKELIQAATALLRNFQPR